VESINAGRFGYTTSEIVGLLHHKVVRHEPDLIILYSTFNDASRKLSPYYGADDGPQLYGNSTLSFLNQHSALFALMDFKLRYVVKSDFYTYLLPNATNYKEPPVEHFKFLRDKKQTNNYMVTTFERNVRTIVSIAKNNHIKILLSTQIFESDKPTTAIVNRLDDILRQISKEENVPLLEANNSKKKDYIKSGILESYVHLTAKGCRVLSDKISNKIISDTLIR
jgi:lysophospholipase L1-like esterase